MVKTLRKKMLLTLTALYELTTKAFKVFIQEASSQPNGSVVWDCLFSMYLADDSAIIRQKYKQQISIIEKNAKPSVYVSGLYTTF